MMSLLLYITQKDSGAHNIWQNLTQCIEMSVLGTTSIVFLVLLHLVNTQTGI